MNLGTSGVIRQVSNLRSAIWAITFGAALFAFGCGSDSHQTNNAANYPTGISDDLEQQLKYDARVESFEPDGETLIVNVNEAWLNSPPGMQERSLGQWYNMWHANHSGGVIVQNDGNKVASWTAESGFKPETKSNGGESQSDS